MTSVGVVRDFDPEEGWGVVDGPDVPGGCLVHYSTIVMGGYRQVTPGQRVSFRFEVANQKGFTFRAVRVWPDGVEPVDPPADQGTSIGYHGVLILTFDQRQDPGKHSTP